MLTSPQTSTTVTPISAEQRQQVITQTGHFITLASDYFGKKFKTVDVTFDLSGGTAGMYRVAARQRWIRYNPYIFSRYFDDSLQNTVPHEVAHYITDCLYGLRKIRPHGIEWKNIMQVFDVEPEVTGHYNLEGIPQRRQQRHDYFCGCRQHRLSSVRHNRIQKKQAAYYCRYCKQALHKTGQQ